MNEFLDRLAAKKNVNFDCFWTNLSRLQMQQQYVGAARVRAVGKLQIT
jgi:hypothetical protein